MGTEASRAETRQAIAMLAQPRCEEEGCGEPGDPYLLENWDPQPGEPAQWTFHYCSAHAHGNGFCCGCGLFWSGCEDFDFAPSGLCSNCRADVEAEVEEYWDGYPFPDPYDGVMESHAQRDMLSDVRDGAGLSAGNPVSRASGAPEAAPDDSMAARGKGRQRPAVAQDDRPPVNWQPGELNRRKDGD